jgi:hypothetical protein
MPLKDHWQLDLYFMEGTAPKIDTDHADDVIGNSSHLA